MKPIIQLACIAVVLSISSCKTIRTTSSTKDDGKIEVVFVQVNDVYEIAPLSFGKEGGMARVATVKKQYLQQNPNTFLVMAGDFVSPTVYNSLSYEGKRIRGRQMVEAMNTAGMDLVVFGNHEFDINENELQDRINESKFHWIASNTFHQQGSEVKPFVKVTEPFAGPFPQTYILPVKDKDGTTAKIGFFGLTIPFNKAPYVSYTDPITTAKEMYNRLKDSVDAVVALTHLAVDDDKRIATEIPGLAVILGGHEHDMRFVKEGNIYITKAHANAKSAYIVKMEVNKQNKTVTVVPELKMIDDKIALDSATNAVVQKWVNIANDNYSQLGFDAQKVVLSSGDPLDGREISVRSRPTNLTRLLVAAMAQAAPNADVVLLNAGSIRVDDIMEMPITQYDILRTLPFGGGIREVEMKGNLLIKTLDQGKKNKDIGGFLQYNEAVTFDEASNTWKLKGMPIDPAKTYRVAMNDFLISGKEANLDFLNTENPDVVKVYEPATGTTNPMADIRLAVVKYLEQKK